MKLRNDSESEKNNNIPKVKINKRTRWLGAYLVNPFLLFNFTDKNSNYIVSMVLKFEKIIKLIIDNI